MPEPQFQDKKTKVPLRVNEQRLIIATCEKGTVEEMDDMKDIKAGLDEARKNYPNFVELAAREAFRSRKTRLVADPIPSHAWTRSTKDRVALMKNRPNLRIGIPRVLNAYVYAPLFNSYFESLGLKSENLIYSDYTSPEPYRAGASWGAIDPCFPAKIGIAHVHNLLTIKAAKKPLDLIFFPMVDVLHTPLVNLTGSNACPTVTACPETVKAAYTKENDVFAENKVKYVNPVLNLQDGSCWRTSYSPLFNPCLAYRLKKTSGQLRPGIKRWKSMRPACGTRRAMCWMNWNARTA
jgi:predicted nucleotide-binding protein (sugar kinase/HSP70/actin superfamily)